MSSVENPGQGSRFPADSPSGIFRIPASFRAAASGRLFDPVERETEAESITVRIRWFGLGIGYLYVNFGTQVGSPRELNAMLTLGAAYALIDTLASWKGRLLLTNYRMAISLMEALFIGLLCHFDEGVTSPFRFYYFLSLMVCAIRHSSSVTYTTFGLHSISYLLLGLFSNAEPRMLAEEDAGSHQLVSGLLTLVFMGWGTWAIVSLTGLLKKAGQRLALLNEQLKSNQQHLERRISARTRELQESQVMLVQQEKQAAFGLLAAGIAHEVGNPLASISSIVQLMSRKNTDSAVGERLQLVDGQLQRIQRILKELTRFSRPANEQLASADVHSAINDALNIAKYYGRWKGKTVVTSFAEGLPQIRTVHDQLVQVMLNLILNALDAMAEGASIEISTRLLAAESGRPERLAIRIRDEGHGISKDAQKQIFQPYFTTKDHGTGLGLFVCRHITRNSLGGDIELVRSDASGTEFEVTLPVQRNTGE